jgi:hypothetical protein
MSGRRWAIEQCFEESKSDVGMDHYEVRTYKGCHHHMLMTMLAHFFLWRLKIQDCPTMLWKLSKPLIHKEFLKTMRISETFDI